MTKHRRVKTFLPLFQHQIEDRDFILEHPSTLLTDDPGCGKTRAVLEAFIDGRDAGERMLVLCPKSIMLASWGVDIEKFTNLSFALAIAPKEKRIKAFESGADVVMLNHDGITWLAKNQTEVDLSAFKWIAVDEFTAYKNHTAARTKSLLLFRWMFEHKVLMSGTPTPNSVMDMYAPALFLDDGVRLGTSYYRMRTQMQTPIPMPAIGITKWVDRADAPELLAQQMFDINIRHKLEEVLDMPEHINRTLEVQLDAKTLANYNDLKEEAILLLKEGEVTAVNKAVLAQKLLQLCAGTIYDSDGTALSVHGERYDLVMELVSEREHSLVAYNWQHQLAGLIEQAEKAGLRWCAITRDMSVQKRGEVVDEFQKGRYQVLFAHPRTAGHGLTLTRARTVIWSSPTWSSESYIQFNRRIYRAGQKSRTEVINIAADNTWETKAYASLEQKVLNQESFLDLITYEDE